MKAMKTKVEESQINRKLTAISKGSHSQLDRIQIPTGQWYYSEKGCEIFHYDKGVWEAYPCKDKELHMYYTHHTLKVIQDDAIPIEVSRLPDAIHIDSFNSTPSTIWNDVTSSEQIEGALLFRNKRHLQQADIEGGVSSSNIMRKIRSEHGLSTFNERIIRASQSKQWTQPMKSWTGSKRFLSHQMCTTLLSQESSPKRTIRACLKTPPNEHPQAVWQIIQYGKP